MSYETKIKNKLKILNKNLMFFVFNNNFFLIARK